MRRHLPRLLLTGALLSPVTLYALGLGEIRLNSALNQPFDAEIELLSPTPEELGSLRVTLASNDVFSRYGIDRPQYLSNFDFSVSRGRDGKATIKVTSNRSVTEPYVTLLVEAAWARGRLVREYTVLLDPPVFMPSQETPAPVTTPQSATTAEGRIERRPTPAPEPTPAPAATPRPTPAPTPAPEPAPTQAQRTEEPADQQVIASPGSEYTVQRNDTLSKIASAANPGPRRVSNQTMIALFRANPQAFSGNNINRLLAGSVLRIPEMSEIEAISTDEADAEVARQTAEWSGGVVADTTPESERLRLVTPQETPTPPTPAPAPQQQAQQQTQPSAAPGTSTPPDRRLEVEDPGLAQAQRNVDPTPAQPPVEETPPTEAQAPSEPTPAAEEPVAPAAEAPPQTPPAATPPPAEPELTLAERLGQYWWLLIAAGLAVVVGAMVAFIRRRRDSDDDSLDSLNSPLAFDPPSERPARALAPSSKGGRADAFLVEGEDDDGMVKTNLDDDLDFDQPPPTTRREPAQARGFDGGAMAAAPVAARAVDDTLSSESAVRFDQQDALAEADFHMAYGLYDQAADLVKIAIDREPGRRDLKLKLLEIYFVWGNKDLFLDTARDLYETRDSAAAGEWDKVLIMGKQIAPEESMFQGEGGHVGLVDVNLEGGENRVDVDLFSEPGQSQGLDLEFASGERRGPNDATQVASDLDFLLDEPNDDDTQEQRTREVDALSRTQETPTIESPMIDRTTQTVREKVDQAVFGNKGTSTGDTAELSIDDLGLDEASLDQGRALEDTTSLEKDTIENVRALRDDEMTQLAPSLSSFDRTMEAPRVERFNGDIESTGTIYIDQVDLTGGGDTAEHPRPDVDSTASMKKPLAMTDIDLDLEDLSDVRVGSDTLRHSRDSDDIFSSDVFGDRTQEVPRGGVDLDVGDPLSSHEDNEPTQRQTMTTEMELSELEPVTMSEVGTKLDLARAYMDMGDPDGARSILDEVLSEGNPSQKQEAQRLMDSIR